MSVATRKASSRGPVTPPGRRPPLPREQRLEQLTGFLTDALPQLGRSEARALLEQTAAGPSLAWLDWHLAERPDTLTSGRSDIPVVVLRLLHTLHGGGYPVVLPGCVRCGAISRTLPGHVDGGRLCKRCADLDRAEPCTRCHRLMRVYARPDSGPICQRCWVSDPDRWERSVRPRGRRERGLCVRCSEQRTLEYHSDDGRLCRACYRKRWIGICTGCSKERQCTPNRALGGQLLCGACWPRKRAHCAGCDRERRILTTWPIGPVCSRCYAWIRSHPTGCARCGNERVLVARDDSGAGICPSCAGLKLDYECRRCGRSDFLVQDHLCRGCLAGDRAETLLAGPDGAVRAELKPFLHALVNADSPHAVLQWLDPRKPAAALLARIAASSEPVSHELLDTLPQTLALHRLRQTLVHTGALPERHDYLERLTPWLEDVLANRPAEHGQLIRPYVHWTLLRRARQRARRGAHVTPGSGQWVRSRTLAALRLLAWLDQQQLTLNELKQGPLDGWLTAHPPTSVYPAREFVAWARRHHLAGPIAIPKYQPASALTPISEDERWAALKRCLHDSTLPLEARAAGALVLLYGLSVRRVSSLHADHLDTDGDATYLRLGQHKLLLPPAVASLLRRQQTQATSVSVIHRSVDAGPGWLFPGGFPGRPARDAIYRKLRAYGIPHARRARSAALITLAAELPPPILAELLDLNINTAVHWAQHSQQDAAAYIEARIATERTRA